MVATSKSSKARALLAQGISNKEIARRTGLSVNTIYTLKWKMANKQGLGAIKPKTPPVAQGTGITSVPRAAVPLEFEIIDRKPKKSNARRNAQLKRWAREREERSKRQMQAQLNDAANMYPKPGQFIGFYGRTPKPSLWQRIKGFFGV